MINRSKFRRQNKAMLDKALSLGFKSILEANKSGYGKDIKQPSTQLSNMTEGVDPESELFTCLWLVHRNAFHFDSLGDPDYFAVCQHLDKLRIKYEVKFGNRMSLHLKSICQECSHCGGLGYDPYPNHDTTMRPCPKCAQ